MTLFGTLDASTDSDPRVLELLGFPIGHVNRVRGTDAGAGGDAGASAGLSTVGARAG